MIAVALYVQHLCKTDEVLNLKLREYATINHYLLSLAEMIAKDPTEIVKQTQKAA